MKSVWKAVSGVALAAVLAFGMIAPGLQAGTAARGEFNMPFNAQWERLGLSTGDYTFSVDHGTLNGTIVVYHGSQAVGMVRPQSFESGENQAKNPELVCIRHDGKVSVRALKLPRVGTFYFALPKDLKALVAQQPQLIETVHLEVRGE
ncbi:MAG: hypothetical protein WAM67_02295 [Candidatus Acidiferrales bacterium]